MTVNQLIQRLQSIVEEKKETGDQDVVIQVRRTISDGRKRGGTRCDSSYAKLQYDSSGTLKLGEDKFTEIVCEHLDRS